MKLFLIPIIVSMAVHSIKMILEIFQKKFSWKRVYGYGGMPSSHSALVASLATAVFLVDGFSIAFSISVILAAVVMRDAVGLRSHLSEHGRILNKLIKDLPDEEEYKYPILEETIAHSILQIAVGAILGIIFTWLAFILI